MPSQELSPRFASLKHILVSRPRPEEERVEAAVGLLLAEVNDQLEGLLIQRAEREGDPWSGQIGLPGGRAKQSDPSIRATLIREVEEEVGIDLQKNGRELGTLSIGHPIRRLELRVQPWVYSLEAKPELRIGPEVSSAFWAPIATLPDTKATTHMFLGNAWRTVECFLVQGNIVWGYTYRVLSEFLELLGVIAKQ